MGGARPQPPEEIELAGMPDVGAAGIQDGRVEVNAKEGKTNVRRDLRGYHVVFITISGVIGAGIYVRSGLMLQVGGPGAILASYAILGIVVWAVMMCIAEMVLIWPVTNAIDLFPRAFVDEELGTVVGIAYWFCYAIGFAALMTAAASEAAYWTEAEIPVIQSIAFYTAPPILLLLFNCLSVKWYGLLEVVGGVMKLLFLFAVIVIMIVINQGVGPDYDRIGGDLWTNQNITVGNNTAVHEGFIDVSEASRSRWIIALFIAIQIGAYSYVGIEIPAVTAVEVQMEEQKNHRLGPKGPGTSALKFSTTRLPVLITLTYLVMGIVASLNVAWNDPCLPLQGYGPSNGSATTKYNTTSVFVCSAIESGIPGLPSVISAFLIFTAWSSANTALYAASRTLYGMARDMDKSEGKIWTRLPLNFVRKFGWTSDGSRVPARAIFWTTVAVIWVPFLHLISGQGSDVTLNVLAEMGSVSCVMVWACLCLACLQFLRMLEIHEENIARHPNMPFLHRKDSHTDDKNPYPYPWRSPAQPGLAIFAFICCMILLVIINGANLWRGWNTAGFIASYLAPICFILLWVALKLAKYGLDWREWHGRNIFDWEECKEALEGLNAARDSRVTGGRSQHQ